MPKRMLSDAVWESKKLRSIQPPELRPEFAWIIPVVEDNGVFEYDPEKLWSRAYALARPGWTPERVEELLNELIRVGILLKYDAEGKSWCCLVGSDKPGFLPKRSERYSKLPLPPVTSGQGTVEPLQGGGGGAVEPRLASGHGAVERLTGIGSGSGLGSGLGSGVGVGSGTGSGLLTGTGTGTGKQVAETTQTVAVTKNSSTPSPSETRQEKRTNATTQSTASPGHSSAETITKIIDGLHRGQFPIQIHDDDPLLPWLAKMTDEALAVAMTKPQSIPVPGWDSEEHSEANHSHKNFIEVLPGDPRYPRPDDARFDGAMTMRHVAAITVIEQFRFAVESLRGLAQHLHYPEKSDVEPGMVPFTQESIRKMMIGFGGFPDGLGNMPYPDLFPAHFWAATHWAFNKSDFWPKWLRTLTDVVAKWPKYSAQYDKYYESVPEGKKPHDLGVGAPMATEEDEELWRAEQVSGGATGLSIGPVPQKQEIGPDLASYMGGEEASFDDDDDEPMFKF